MAGQVINISTFVDTETILQNGGVPSSQVIYMVDDNVLGGSIGEGGNELNSACSPGDTLVWTVQSINFSDSVTITRFNNSSGDVFGQNPNANGSSTMSGNVTLTGNETYQLTILINGAVQYQWDPFLTSTAAVDAQVKVRAKTVAR